MSQSKRTNGLVAALLAATVLAGSAAPAFAQATPEAPQDSSASSSGGSLDIVVTARKREERLQDIPVAVSAIGGAALEQKGIDNVTNLIGTVPSLFTSQNQAFGPLPNQTYLVLRGVGAAASNDPAVGTFVDGVYQPSLAFDTGFLDLERIEVLRGPQGTLFGRNTEGGALNIVTAKPDGTFRGKLRAEYADFNSVRLGTSFSGPLVEDKLFASLSGQYYSTDGYIHNLTIERDQDTLRSLAGRFVLRALPTEDFEIILRLDGSRNRNGYLGYGVVDDGTKRYATLDDRKVVSPDTSFGGSLTMSYDLSAFTIKSITGYQHVKTEFWYDFDGYSDPGNFQDQRTTQSALSEELRFESKSGGSFTWLGGLYAFQDIHEQNRNFALSGCTICAFPPIFNTANDVREATRLRRRGWAAFGQVGYKFNDRFELTVGGRYGWERTRAFQQGVVIVPAVGANDAFSGITSKSFSNFSPSASFSVHWTPDVMTYATVSRGYRSGGFDKYPGSSAAVGIAFDNEKSTNYELGLKASLFDRHLIASIAGFIVQVDDMQLASVAISPVTGLPVGVTANVGASRNRGFEFEATAMPFRGFKVRGNAAYTDARFTSITSPVGSHLTGDALPYVPKWTASGGADYTVSIGDAELNLAADYRYVGPYYSGNGAPPFDPILQVQSYDQLDLRASLKRDRWELTVYVDNVTDNFNITRRFAPPFQPFTRASVLPPRKFGVKLNYSW
ncbi:TonB-dependent receptor [Sphingobium sp. CAP-1]|uniref:TonB-dependent receptor n=1 Tax=Sphingobium sp. CAP-1 TaxID=2676077 RepID=UPI0012BB351F|nr:TonB-dependent receptor [Sphingobium sp. CAP-1]QGP77757.1 TonB-dependent receptor [Sphingobium sp. CAP-1]|tara:strand:- start:19347 stop:21536 length:2190 start_codon:yes stop_codon:yes gene_type:complete